MIKNFGAIILAAGKGKRMQMDSANKVTNLLGDKPIIVHVVHFLKSLGISEIVVVVGHQKESVIESLKGEEIIYAEQKEQLGSSHAVQASLSVLPSDLTDVIVVYGDEAVLYSEDNVKIINKLLDLHKSEENSLSLLTITLDDSFGLGRIIRDSNGKIISIIEEKDASDEQRAIKEINPGCFVFSVDFLKKYIPLVKKSEITGEYYLTSLVDLAVNNGERVDTLRGGKLRWRGINTRQELEEAKKLYEDVKN